MSQVNYKVIEDWLEKNGDSLDSHVWYNINLLCKYAQQWDERIEETVKAYPKFGFKLKGTNREIIAINPDLKEFELTN